MPIRKGEKLELEVFKSVHIVPDVYLGSEGPKLQAAYLKKIISNAGNNDFSGLSFLERIYLALTLASSIWDSHNVSQYWERSASRADFELPSFIDLSDMHPAESLKVMLHIDCPDFQRHLQGVVPAILNNKVFGIGILLLEIGTGRPLKSLRRPEDIIPGESNDLTLLRIMTRAKGKISKLMEPLYQEIVWKCLDCDFDIKSLDKGLNDFLVQDIFYGEDIEKLEFLFSNIEEALDI
jgi:hypothetical protein